MKTVRLEQWLRLSVMLSVFGFLKELRPSEHFVYDYLVGGWRNVTKDQVNREVYPVATYSYLAQLVVMFLVTDLLRYKPLIVTLALSGIATWAILLWTETLLWLQAGEVLYGTFMATEVAYYTYIYAKVPRDKYQQVTSHTRAGLLAGKFLSGLVGQVLVSFHVMDFRQLNYITFSAMLLATVWALLLPPVHTSIYFNQGGEGGEDGGTWRRCARAARLLRHHFLAAYGNARVLKWSVWWACSTCGFIQVQTYMQPLWATVQPDTGSGVYNGAVEAALTLLAVLGALAAGALRVDWQLLGELVLSVCSIVQGAALLLASQTQHVAVAYGCYVAFGALFYFMITVVYSEVAKDILPDSYGLVFGFNMLVALTLNTGLMLAVVDDVGLRLEARAQFLVYGAYFMLLAALFVAFGLVGWWRTRAPPRTPQ